MEQLFSLINDVMNQARSFKIVDRLANFSYNLFLSVPRLVEKLHAAYDYSGNYYLDNVDVGGIHIKSDYSEYNFQYLLGLLNSKLLQWYFPKISAPFRGGGILQIVNLFLNSQSAQLTSPTPKT